MIGVLGKSILFAHTDDGRVRGPQLLVVRPDVPQVCILHEDDHRGSLERGPEVIRIQIRSGVPDLDEPLPGRGESPSAGYRDPAPGIVGGPGAAEKRRQVRAVLKGAAEQPHGVVLFDHRQEVCFEERVELHTDGIFLPDTESPCEGGVVPPDLPVVAYHKKSIFESVEHRMVKGCPVLVRVRHNPPASRCSRCSGCAPGTLK